jgi:hypothetical protein
MKKVLITLAMSMGIISGYGMLSWQGWKPSWESDGPASQPTSQGAAASGGSTQQRVLTPAPKPLPVKVTALTPTTVCAGDSVQLEAPAGYAEYLWSNGATTQTIWAKAGGHYTVRVANTAGGPLSDTLGGYYNSGITVYPAGATGDDSVLEPFSPLGSPESIAAMVGLLVGAMGAAAAAAASLEAVQRRPRRPPASAQRPQLQHRLQRRGAWR